VLKNKKFVIGAVIVLIAAAVLGYIGFMGTGTYYYDVGEFLDKETTLAGQTIRVSGIVDQIAPPAKVGLTLKLSVVYNGTTPPDTFKPGQQAVVEGKYDTASGSFKGTNIIVKCGSKYEPA
jgi:cytochrome c-type biogenesis protein CcmE